MEKNRLDAFFREALLHSKVSPDHGAWTRLDERLGRRRRLTYRRVAAMAAAASLLLATVWFWPAWNRRMASPVALNERPGTQSGILEPGNLLPSIPSPPDVNEVRQNDTMAPTQTAVQAARKASRARAVADEAKQVFPSAAEARRSRSIEVDPQHDAAVLADVSATDPLEEGSGRDGNGRAMTDEPLAIRITYKRGNPRPSATPTADDGSLLVKGVKKLGQLAGDINVSEETKEKLRNTRDDLLAFNIEKLFKKEDKTIEQ